MQETLYYIEDIRGVWGDTFNKDEQTMRKVDQATATVLQVTGPGGCKSDAEAIYGKLKSAQIPGAFNKQERELICNRMLAVSKNRLILSFSTIFLTISLTSQGHPSA
jgi:glutamate synthase domain-containing protein 1